MSLPFPAALVDLYPAILYIVWLLQLLWFIPEHL